MATNDISAVIGPEFRKPFALLVALCASVGVLLFGISSAENFVDGRVELKIAEQRRTVDEHEKRLTKIEEKLGSMNDVLAEIRADVKVLRATMEHR